MIDRDKLSNGLTVIYRHTPQDPIAACHLFLPNGAIAEPSEKAGLSTLHWSLFLKGTKKRSAKKLAEDIEMLGASTGAGSTYDYSEISCHSPSDQIQMALAIMAECLFDPLFEKKEIAKEKSALQAGIRSKKESIFTITHEKLNQHLYPHHPYGRPSSGSEETVEKIQEPDLWARHADLLQSDGAILSMASDIPFKKIEPHLKNLFGPASWPATANKLKKFVTASPPSAAEEFKCLSHFEQAYLMIGFSAAPMGSPDYVPLKVLNGILGGGMSTRLFQNLREKEGLAYDVGSFYPTKKFGSAFIFHMGLQAARLIEAKQGILRELEKIQETPVPEAELAQVKNQMKGTFILDHQTNSQRAHYLGWWEIVGLGADTDLTYPSQLEAVTASDIQRIAQKYFSGPSITVETVPKSKNPAPEPVSHGT